MTTSIPGRCRTARQGAKLDALDLANRIGIRVETVLGYDDPLWPYKREVPFLRRWAQVCGVGEEWLLLGTEPGEGPAST